MYWAHYNHWPDPITLAVIGIGAGLGLSTYATLSAGSEAAKAGKEAAKYGAYQQKLYENEAKVTQRQAEEEAKATLYAGQYESREKRKEKARTTASRIAQVFAQGGTITGSKLINIADEATEYEADAGMIMHNYQLKATQTRYEGLLRSIQLRNRGKMALYEGQVAKYQGAVEKRASRIRAFSDIAMTVGMVALMGGFKTPAKLSPGSVPPAPVRGMPTGMHGMGW